LDLRNAWKEFFGLLFHSSEKNYARETKEAAFEGQAASSWFPGLPVPGFRAHPAIFRIVESGWEGLCRARKNPVFEQDYPCWFG